MARDGCGHARVWLSDVRILILSQYFWPEGFQINEIASALVARGNEVDVLTGKPNYPAGRIFPDYRAGGCQREAYGEHGAISVYRIPMLARGSGALRLALNYLAFVVSGLLFGPLLLRGKQYDVIFVYAPSPILQAIPAILLGWLKRCPTVLWVQDLWPESLSATGYVRNACVLGAVERVVRFIYRRIDLLLVQSEAFVGPVSALASGTPVLYHPNSVDDSFSAPGKGPVTEVDGLNTRFSVMFAGNIGSAQAVDVIVEAAAILRHEADIAFVVVGDGSRHAWMLEQKAARGLDNLFLPGRFPVAAMPGMMRRASALLVTLADQEIFRYTVPSKIQAYLAAGRPIIAALNGEGARLVLAAGAGLTVGAGDGRGLADAVLAMARMTPQQRDELGHNASNYHLKHFSHAMLVDRLHGLLSECAVGHGTLAVKQ
jgi:glycosyltransferase involved in cell wall biosynthesis